MSELMRTEVNGSLGLTAAGIDVGGIVRFIPEPKSSFGDTLRGVMRHVGESIGSGIGGVVSGTLPPELTELLNKQIEIQLQMQLVSLISNIEKSRHEMEMAPIRNIRVG